MNFLVIFILYLHKLYSDAFCNINRFLYVVASRSQSSRQFTSVAITGQQNESLNAFATLQLSLPGNKQALILHQYYMQL